MNVTRLAVALAVGATALVSGAATAAPVKVCNLVTDPSGDTFLLRYQDELPLAGHVLPYGPQEDGLDITSVDVATNATTITAVVRFKAVSSAIATSPRGYTARVQFATPDALGADRTFYLDALVTGGTGTFQAGYRDVTANVSTKLTDATGVIDTKANEIRISAPLSAWASTNGGLKNGTVLDMGYDQTASRFVATNPATGSNTSAFADVVVGEEKSYKVGTPSCVPVGK